MDAAGALLDMYRPEDMPLSPSLRAWRRAPPMYASWLAPATRRLHDGQRLFMATPREIQEMSALTYAVINIDDRIGMVSEHAARVRRPQHGGDLHLDHGDLLGDHGIVLKAAALPGLVRVPFILARTRLMSAMLR